MTTMTDNAGESQSVLVVDDSVPFLRTVKRHLQGRYKVALAERGTTALALIEQFRPAVVLVDLRMPEMDGLELLRAVKSTAPKVPVVMMTSFAQTHLVVEAVRCGASQFVDKEQGLQHFDEVLSEVVRGSNDDSANQSRRVGVCCALQDDELILDSNTAEAVDRLKEHDETTVLISGPTGVGKGALAELIHSESSRCRNALVDVNCAGLSESLLDSELFGHERGAFTNADRRKRGLMELADNGTLFLDEIGDMPQAIQAKVLKAFETRTFRRVGGTESIGVNLRIIAATNADLPSLMERGLFRSDLYYRLSVVPITLLPLRQRRRDIPRMTQLFVKKCAVRAGKDIQGISAEALSILSNYDWPGNIRELRNVVERACILCRNGEIGTEDLPTSVTLGRLGTVFTDGTQPLSLRELEMQHIRQTLEFTGHNKAAAARILGINISTLMRKLRARG